MEYITNILSLEYNVIKTKVKLPPPLVDGKDGMPVYPNSRAFVTFKFHINFLTGIQLPIPKGHVATISRITNPFSRESLFCPRIIIRPNQSK